MLAQDAYSSEVDESLAEWMAAEIEEKYKSLKASFGGKAPGVPVDDRFLKRPIHHTEVKDLGQYAKAILDTYWRGKSDQQRLHWLRSLADQMYSEAEAAELATKKRKIHKLL